MVQFQSTPSVGRATLLLARSQQSLKNFNPRPPWGGRREEASLRPRFTEHFNPRPPWGGRRWYCWTCHKGCPFQSTPSVGRATLFTLACTSGRGHFNPRPPWGGRLVSLQCGGKTRGDFNPRPPWGGRPRICDSSSSLDSISIHALRGEGDGTSYYIGYRFK